MNELIANNWWRQGLFYSTTHDNMIKRALIAETCKEDYNTAPYGFNIIKKNVSKFRKT